jgi:hypothetical protein
MVNTKFYTCNYNRQTKEVNLRSTYLRLYLDNIDLVMSVTDKDIKNYRNSSTCTRIVLISIDLWINLTP